MKVIKVAEETKGKLDSLKHPGQTYDGIIREIIEENQNNKKRRVP